MSKSLIVTEADYRQFDELIIRMLPRAEKGLHDKLLEFGSRLDEARVIRPEEIPGDIVTVGSRVELEDRSNGEVIDYAVVWPHEADIERGRISVLSPVGMNLYGSKVGHEVNCPAPGGIRTLFVRKMLYQPERDLV